MFLGYLPDRRPGRVLRDARVRQRSEAGRAPGDGRHAGRHRQRAGRAGRATTCRPAASPSGDFAAQRGRAGAARRCARTIWQFPQAPHRLPHLRHRRARHRGLRLAGHATSAATIRAGTTSTAPCAASTARAPRRSDPGDETSTVMHVAAPVRDGDAHHRRADAVAKPNAQHRALHRRQPAQHPAPGLAG